MIDCPNDKIIGILDPDQGYGILGSGHRSLKYGACPSFPNQLFIVIENFDEYNYQLIGKNPINSVSSFNNRHISTVYPMYHKY